MRRRKHNAMTARAAQHKPGKGFSRRSKLRNIKPRRIIELIRRRARSAG